MTEANIRVRYDRQAKLIDYEGNKLPLRQFLDQVGLNRDDVMHAWDQPQGAQGGVGGASDRNMQKK